MRGSKMVALSAICAGFASVLVILGNLFSLVGESMFFVASLFVMCPILAGSYKGGVLAGIASFVIGFLFVPNIFTMITYLIFFLPYVVVLCFCEDKIKNRFLALCLKLAFFALSLVGIWKWANVFVGFEFLNLPLAVLFACGIAVLFVFDFFARRVRLGMKYQLYRILKY